MNSYLFSLLNEFNAQEDYDYFSKPFNKYKLGDTLVLEILLAGYKKEDLEVSVSNSKSELIIKTINSYQDPSNKFSDYEIVTTHLDRSPLNLRYRFDKGFKFFKADLEGGILTVTFKLEKLDLDELKINLG